jgi:hypothetical protein
MMPKKIAFLKIPMDGGDAPQRIRILVQADTPGGEKCQQRGLAANLLKVSHPEQ